MKNVQSAGRKKENYLFKIYIVYLFKAFKVEVRSGSSIGGHIREESIVIIVMLYLVIYNWLVVMLGIIESYIRVRIRRRVRRRVRSSVRSRVR